MKKSFRIAAPAKINLGLDVLGRRPDAYHEVHMLMQTVSLHDDIWMEWRPDTGSLSCEGVSGVPEGPENLAWKAWELLKAEYQLPGSFDIHIEKRIPMAAGLGGGSSDAAAVLCGANMICGLEKTAQELRPLAAKLGADVPFFLPGGSAEVRGIGDELEFLEGTPRLWVLLVNPGKSVSTAEVYRRLDEMEIKKRPDIPALKDMLREGNVSGLLRGAVNVLEEPAMAICPEIRQIKEELQGMGLPAWMSGSGATVFTLSVSRERLLGVAAIMQAHWGWAEVAATE